jgi:hypothetical protein
VPLAFWNPLYADKALLRKTCPLIDYAPLADLESGSPAAELARGMACAAPAPTHRRIRAGAEGPFGGFVGCLAIGACQSPRPARAFRARACAPMEPG